MFRWRINFYTANSPFVSLRNEPAAKLQNARAAISPLKELTTIFPLLCLILVPTSGRTATKQAGTTQYAVTVLGVLDNPGSSTVVRQVNSYGEAVGSYNNSNKLKQDAAAFIVTSAGGFDEITDQQATDFSALYGINDTGEVAGVINGPINALPFRAVRHTQFQLLPLLSGDTSGGAYGINDQGESAGYSGGGSGSRAVWWTQKGGLNPLASPTGFTNTRALHINKLGDIVGYAGDDVKIGVLWPAKGSPIQLSTLATFVSSQAESVSDDGNVVGSAIAFDPDTVRMRAVLWPAGTSVPQDLGTLPGGAASRARDVDTIGTVVGTSDSSAGNRAFLWTAATGMLDLNTLSNDPSMILVDALCISKQGAVLALAIRQSDLPAGVGGTAEEHELPRSIVLLTPLP